MAATSQDNKALPLQSPAAKTTNTTATLNTTLKYFDFCDTQDHASDVLIKIEEASPDVSIPAIHKATTGSFHSMLEENGLVTEEKPVLESNCSNFDPRRYQGSASQDPDYIARQERLPYPSLLRYVDNDLMVDDLRHNNPPETAKICPGCGLQHDQAAIPSTYLPLRPCGHWMHYRCFIFWTSQLHNQNNKCPVCNCQLYEREGIAVLTLATRTSLPMADNHWEPAARYRDEKTGYWCCSDREEYIVDCLTIDEIIKDVYFHHYYREQLSDTPKYQDHSPNLVQVFYDVLTEISKRKLPRAQWLRWKTWLGYLLFGMLVLIKMRRYLSDTQPGLAVTQGWNDFEGGYSALQARILEEVRRKKYQHENW
ncbi:hypothetical protein BS50DRAFT_662063 [Corynespora cassiicola Philippines]|uniref:RING-type domain-containing protein n=1 Tax=Corynespora cassiicola Philippines TaxID=1448308 RepID=A0A2T2NY68_CORCC|nr:hypothetical protein BS50DRAFT_662063 [Corynespora cassiicola Philippines]